MKPADLSLALAVVLIWGFNFVVVKLGLQGLPPILFTALRFTFAAVPLVLFIRRPAIPWRQLASFALFQFVLQFTLLFSGMKLGFPPGLTALVDQVQVFFTMGLAALVLGERPLKTQLVGALVAFGGIALVGLHIDAQATMIGFALVIASGFSWGVGNIVTKRSGAADPLALVVWGALLAAPMLMAASLLIEGPATVAGAMREMNWLSAGAVLFQAYPVTLFGYWIWSTLLRRYPSAAVAPFTLLVPVVAMLSSSLLLGEPLQWWKMAAALLVLGGLALNQFGAYLTGFVRRAQ